MRDRMRSVTKGIYVNHVRHLLCMLCISCISTPLFAKDGFPQFNGTEKQWIQSNPVVKFSIHEKYRHYWNSGIYPRLLAKLKDCSGLDFQPIWRTSDQTTLEQLQSKQINFIIDPVFSPSNLTAGFISDTIFWGQDVVLSTNNLDTKTHSLQTSQTIYFDRGYSLENNFSKKTVFSSPELMMQKLINGEAQFAVMPLRLAMAINQDLKLNHFQIKPWGHQPFAYRWLISKHDEPLNSIIQKSLKQIDPIVLGDLLSIPIPELNPLDGSIDKKRLGINPIVTAAITALFVLGFGVIHHQFHRKRQAKKEAGLLEIAHQAKTASDAKSAFLATMSHEIRTPMNAVIGAQELLLKNTSLNSKQKSLLQSAQSSAASLLGILNQVLDVAKIESGKFTLEFEPVDLKQILFEINQTFSVYAHNKGLMLNASVDPSIADVLLIDELRLRQVLHNLLSNAIKFTEHGLIYFDVRILANDHAGQLIEFRIIDHGIGMSQDAIKRALMPFEQVHSHFSPGLESNPGTGLGLSISNHLVELMQSQLLIESAPNLGTNIHFAVAFSRTGLPLESSDKGLAHHHRIHFKNIRALIVEDHPANRQILWMQLQALDITADQCANGEEAIHLLQKNRYDLVLTDHSMPGMHGVELAKQIRLMCQKQPIIIGITADIYAQQAHPFLLDSGMDAVLIKPVSLEVLEEHLNTLLGEPIKSNLENYFGINADMNILILAEVLKVQNEAILALELDSDAGLLDEGQLKALIHKVKGGAILSEAMELHALCLNLEKSHLGIADKRQCFRQALLINNAVLEKKIQELKEQI